MKKYFSITNSLLPLEGKSVILLILRQWRICQENSCLVQQWKADVFCSSWISNTGAHRPSCAELALVHDCLPERIRPDQPDMMSLRRRWLQQAVVHLAVSSATAEDLAHFLQKSDLQLSWCHLALQKAFQRPQICLARLRLGTVLSRRQACPMSLFFCRDQCCR